MTFETLKEFLSLVQDLHVFHTTEANTLHAQRLEGLVLYVGAVGGLIVFFASHATKTPAIKYGCALLVTLATVVVLLFQVHWNYYAHRHAQWAKEYQNEMEHIAFRMHTHALDPSATFDGLTPFTGQGETCAPSNGCWRKRKSVEIDRDWCHPPSIFGAHWRLDCVNNLRDGSWYISVSSRQGNMWTYSISLFWVLAMFYIFFAEKAFAPSHDRITEGRPSLPPKSRR